MSTPPLRCREARPYLSAYVDRELDHALQNRIKVHLDSCAACSREVVRYQALDDMLATLPAPGPSPEVLDRVLSASYRANRERAVRESLLRPERPVVSRSLPAFLITDTNQAAPLRLGRGSSELRTGRLFSRALPALAALLIITLTLISFHGRPGQVSTILIPTPNLNMEGQIALTQMQVFDNEKIPSLGFLPQLPSYLPPGAQLAQTTVGTFIGTTRHYLDVTWSLPAPMQYLHLREADVPLVNRTDYVKNIPTATQTWDIPDMPQWVNMGFASGSENRLVEGEDRGTFSITLDIGEGPYALANLRLTSLSIDAKYHPLNGVSAPSSSQVVHYQMLTTGGNSGNVSYLWDVYWDQQRAEGNAALYSTGLSGAKRGSYLYTDYRKGDTVTRCTTSYSCASISAMSPEAATDPFALGDKVQTFFETINGPIGRGELWNAGNPSPAPVALGIGTQDVYALDVVDGPYPITVYVSMAGIQLQVVGMISQVAAGSSPGGVDAEAPFWAVDGCHVGFPVIAFGSESAQAFSQWSARPSPQGSGPQIAAIATCTHD